MTRPARVQISYLEHEPYPQRADLAIRDRLAEITAEEGGIWTLLDDHGETHHVDCATREVPTPDPAQGRWVVQGPVPTHAIGDRVQLAWLHRNRAPGRPRRDDRMAEVVEEDAETITVLDSQGERHRIWRVIGHQVTNDRRGPHWVVVRAPARDLLPLA